MYNQIFTAQRKAALQKEKKYVRKHLTGIVICGTIAIAFLLAVVFFNDNFVESLNRNGASTLILLLVELIGVTFYFQGACIWAKFGHAETGFKEPEYLRYPLYGTWWLFHIFVRFFYYMMFVSIPIVIGLFISIPVVVHLVRKILHIRKEEEILQNSNCQ